MRTLPTLAVIVAMTIPVAACREPVAQDLPPLADGCPGYQVKEPRVMASGGFVTPPKDYRDNTRIDYASIPANPEAFAAIQARAAAAHDNLRKVTFLGEGAWDVRVYTWGHDGQEASYYGNRDPDGGWAIETARGQAVNNGVEVGMPISGKVLKGNLGTQKGKRMNEIIKNSACVLREPVYYDGGAPNGPGCRRGTNFFIEVKTGGRTHAVYQGCRAHGLTGEAAMILRSVVPTKKSVS